MKRDAIQAWIDQRPFIPFLIRTKDGGAYFVRHTDYISLSEDNLTLRMWDDHQKLAELNTLDIVALEYLGFADRVDSTTKTRKPHGRK